MGFYYTEQKISAKDDQQIRSNSMEKFTVFGCLLPGYCWLLPPFGLLVVASGCCSLLLAAAAAKTSTLHTSRTV